MIRSSVDLPQPDGPISETNSPGSIVEVDVLERGDVALRERFVTLSILTTAADGRSCDVLRRAPHDELLATDDDEEEERCRARRR